MYFMMYVLISVFVNLIQASVILEEGTSVDKMFVLDWSVGSYVGHFLTNS